LLSKREKRSRKNPRKGGKGGSTKPNVGGKKCPGLCRRDVMNERRQKGARRGRETEDEKKKTSNAGGIVTVIGRVNSPRRGIPEDYASVTRQTRKKKTVGGDSKDFRGERGQSLKGIQQGGE